MSIHLRGGEIELKSAPPAQPDEPTFDQVIGRSRALLAQLELARRFAHEDGAVLISGETGTGKDLLARAMHHCGSRRSRPFLPINCAALPPNLLENELFGHAPGAFTGAQGMHKGLFEGANAGILFLDEIDSLAPEVQPKLLRALEVGEIRRLGDTVTRRLDVRVISATKQDLLAQVESSRFRADLYYRLNALSITLPPLRDRRGDIPLLAEYYLKRRIEGAMSSGHLGAAGRAGIPTCFTADAIEKLCAYHWPGNVRELRNVIDQAFALSNEARIGVRDLHLESVGVRSILGAGCYRAAKGSFQVNYVRGLLEAQSWDVRRAQTLSGLSRSAFYALMRKCDLGGHRAQMRRTASA